MQFQVFNLSKEIARIAPIDGGYRIAGKEFTKPVLISHYGDSESNFNTIQFKEWKAPKLVILESTFFDLSIEDCQFDEIQFINVKVGHSLSFNSPFTSMYLLRNIKADTILLDGGGDIDIGHAEVRDTQITIEKPSTIELRGNFYNGLASIKNKEKYDHKNHKIKLDSLSNIDLSISIKLDEISFISSFSNTKIKSFQNPASHLEFSAFSSKDRLILNKLTVDRNIGTLSMTESDFSNVNFYECDLKAKNFFINNCLLSNCQSFETDWPVAPNLHQISDLKKTNDIAYPSYSSEEFTRQKISYFRQLKNIYEKGGDILRSAQYRMHELSELERVCDNWIDRVPLWVGNMSSKHGTNWIIPLGWMLGLSFIFTIGCTLSLPGSCEPTNCNIAHNMITSINPTHKISEYSYLSSFTELHEIPWWFLWIDLIFRAINSYLIFQVVRSFRKFIK